MSFWYSWGIRGVGYDVLEGSDGENERLRWVQARIQLGEEQGVKGTDLVMGVERGQIWVHVHHIMNAWTFCGQGDIQNQLTMGALRDKASERGGEREEIGRRDGNNKPFEWKRERQWKARDLSRGAWEVEGYYRRDRGMETDVLNGKGEEEGGEGEEER